MCRICKATFTSRNSGARHVMAKHAIMNRKRASEYIHCMRVHEKKGHASGFVAMLNQKVVVSICFAASHVADSLSSELSFLIKHLCGTQLSC